MPIRDPPPGFEQPRRPRTPEAPAKRKSTAACRHRRQCTRPHVQGPAPGDDAHPAALFHAIDAKSHVDRGGPRAGHSDHGLPSSTASRDRYRLARSATTARADVVAVLPQPDAATRAAACRSPATSIIGPRPRRRATRAPMSAVSRCTLGRYLNHAAAPTTIQASVSGLVMLFARTVAFPIRNVKPQPPDRDRHDQRRRPRSTRKCEREQERARGSEETVTPTNCSGSAPTPTIPTVRTRQKTK